MQHRFFAKAVER